jgi:predicted HAD superfamily phosphohydrolase YqeG
MSDFKDKLKTMSDEELRTFVPDVYQKKVYKIDYAKLKAAGVKCISFDIDGTISDGIMANAGTVVKLLHEISDKKIALFERLKSMGFIVGLITNSTQKHADRFRVALKCDFAIGLSSVGEDAKKPSTWSLQKVQRDFNLEKSQMAHVGNQVGKDVKAANDFGIISCLVRTKGDLDRFVSKLKKDKEHRLREELKKRKLWRKSHKHEDDDQYYQLGETPRYRTRG